MKIFFRTLEALEDLFKALWKILEDLLQDLWSSWRSCQKSMKNPGGSFKLLRILSKMKNPWRYLKFLLRSLEIFHFHAKSLNSSGEITDHITACKLPHIEIVFLICCHILILYNFLYYYFRLGKIQSTKIRTQSAWEIMTQ